MGACVRKPAPRVSVLLPVYNAARYVDVALGSIVAQTLTDFEAIVVDDGSTDASREILRRWADRDRRIVLLRRPNGGHTSALNQALGLARGEYLARMDADDVACPQRFAQQVALLDESPEVVAVGGAIELIDPQGRPLVVRHFPVDHAAIDMSNLTGIVQLAHPAVMLRASALREVGGYDPSAEPAEDLELWLRLAEHGRLANVPDVVLQYRLHRNSVSQTRHVQQVAAARAACERAWARRGVSGRFGWHEAAWTDTTFLLQCGRWALASGHRRTALAYGLKLLWAAPRARRTWRFWRQLVAGTPAPAAARVASV